MDSEFDDVGDGEFEEEDGQSYVIEEYDDRESSTRGLMLVVVMILMTFLFMVFCPVEKVEKKKAVAATKPKVHKGPGIIGDTKYEVISGKTEYKIGDKQSYSKAKLIVVTFSVENLSDVTKTFDSYMVGLDDESVRSYPVHPDFSMLIYEVQDKSYPLPVRVAAHGKRNVTLVFAVERASIKYKLVGRDFNATSTKSTKVDVPPVFDPKTPYKVEPLPRY